MANFTGTLNANEIYAALFNMIISQEVFADNITVGNRLVDKAKTEGGLYGDTKLYYSVDVLKSRKWGADNDTNVLELHRAKSPECQAIVLDQFFQIALTNDYYLSKRAWGTEGAFISFNSVTLGMIRNTKDIIDSTTYNSFIGTAISTIGKQNQEWAISDEIGNAEGLEKARIQATAIARNLADLFVELTDNSRDYNDYGNMRQYTKDMIKVVWNSKWYNQIRKVDLPTIFHKEGIVDKFDSDVLPARFFGAINAEGGTTTSSNTTVRSLIEKDYGDKHLFPGDLLPNSTEYLANETYTEDPDVLCKVFIKYPPFMGAFETGTSFFNPRSLTENHYLTWGRNTLEYLKNYPFITVHID